VSTLSVRITDKCSHIPAYGNPGFGYVVFYRRLLLVLVGFAGAIIVQAFPTTPSATKHTAKGLSSTLRAISNLYAMIVAKWVRIASDAPAAKNKALTKEGSSEPIAVSQPAQEAALAILELLVAVGPTIKSVSMEPSTSPFTAGSLENIHGLLMGITDSLAQMISQYETLPPHFRDRFRSQTAALNEALIADVLAVLHLVEAAIRTGQPLPEIMPTPLIAKSVGLSTIKGYESLSKSLIEDENWPAYSVLATTFPTFLARVDALVLAVKQAVGETDYIGAMAEQGGWGFGDLTIPRNT
jgi:hypothetical protein